MTTQKMVPLLDRNEVANYFQVKSQEEKDENNERKEDASTDDDYSESDEDFMPARKRKRHTTNGAFGKPSSESELQYFRIPIRKKLFGKAFPLGKL